MNNIKKLKTDLSSLEIICKSLDAEGLVSPANNVRDAIYKLQGLITLLEVEDSYKYFDFHHEVS